MDINIKKRQPNKTLSPEQIQKRKKLVIFPLMFAGFALAMYFIFKPSVTSNQEKEGLNTDLPIPKTEIIDNKKTAYEMELLEKSRKDKRMLSLKDFGIAPDTTKNEVIVQSIATTQKRPESSIHLSANTYKSVNRNLNSFYDQPAENTREKELANKVEQLQAELDKKDTGEDELLDQQLRVMEESYKMAAKYMPSMQGQTQPEIHTNNNTSSAETNRKIVPVARLSQSRVVSALPQTISDSAFADRCTKPLNSCFFTAGVSSENQIQKNTIEACVHSDQVITPGQNVRLRLLDAIQADNLIIPRHEIITGTASLQGERLNILVSSLEYSGKIVPVEMTVYDTDGQQGIFVPGSMGRNAVKSILSNMGSSAQSSISINQQSATEQLATDLGRNIMQGGSQYLSKRLQTVKIKLKAGYQLMLLPKQQ
nr:conjugative transposon protein TraM [uncultured Draconibacterium sp.]